MERYDLDAVVIGAGVVGLAVARDLALQGRIVWVLDRCSNFGQGTSSRNSEVIHAGIYYEPEGLKASLCVRGKALLYDYAATKDIPYSACGKLIVATNAGQLEKLVAIQLRAAENGVRDLSVLDGRAISKLEPSLNTVGGLLSASTGIVDSHALMQSLLTDAELAGATFVPSSNVHIKSMSPQRFELELVGQGALINTPILVNAAGLYAPHLVRGVDGFPEHCLPEATYAKGSYFTYSGRVPFKHLIYPVPEEGGLGVHLTLDMGGAARFGPDVEWLGPLDQPQLDTFDYTVDAGRRNLFASRVAEYWPGIEPDRLLAGYSGLRPKIAFGGDLSKDFCIQTSAEHGLEGLVNLFGIESPGLTSSLAIAEYVSKALTD